jgi:hypothetical protein
MGVELLNFKDGILTLTISGRLLQPDLATAQKSASEIIRKHGDIRILVMAENFAGWAKEGDWGDISFQIEHDQNIKKIAFLVEKKWEDLMNAFIGKGLREFPVERFEPSDKAKALEWLGQN